TSRNAAKKTTTSATVRVARPRRVTANAMRNTNVRTSASETLPAMFQRTFSNVTQKAVASSRKSVKFRARKSEAPQEVWELLDAVAEAERLHELQVARAEVADEADRHVLEPGVGERLQERTRVALAEERARVREAEAMATPVLEAGEVVEVAAVRDRDDPS